MAKLDIEKAHELGFCFGVRRAIKLLEAARRPSRRHREAAEQGRAELARDRASRRCVRIDLDCDREQLRDSLLQLKEILARHPGATPVVLNVCEAEGACRVVLPGAFTVEYSRELAQAVSQLLGNGCIRTDTL